MKKHGMRSTFLCIVFSLVFIAALSSQTAYDDLNLKAKEGEPLDYTLNHRFSASDALFRLKQIRDSHTSTVEMINKDGSGISKKDRDILSNSLDFEWVNWSNGIEGAVRKQDYRIARLEYLFAQEKVKDGRIDKQELDLKKQTYDNAKKEFEKFFNSFRIID